LQPVLKPVAVRHRLPGFAAKIPVLPPSWQGGNLAKQDPESLCAQAHLRFPACQPCKQQYSGISQAARVKAAASQAAMVSIPWPPLGRLKLYLGCRIQAMAASLIDCPFQARPRLCACDNLRIS